MHHTIDKIPDEKNEKKYPWQKRHEENKTGSIERHRPIKFKRAMYKKNMKHGNKTII